MMFHSIPPFGMKLKSRCLVTHSSYSWMVYRLQLPLQLPMTQTTLLFDQCPGLRSIWPSRDCVVGLLVRMDGAPTVILKEAAIVLQGILHPFITSSLAFHRLFGLWLGPCALKAVRTDVEIGETHRCSSGLTLILLVHQLTIVLRFPISPVLPF